MVCMKWFATSREVESPECPFWGAEGINVYTTRPSTRGTQAMGVHLGSFLAQVGGVMSNIA